MKAKISALIFLLGIVIGGTMVFFLVKTPGNPSVNQSVTATPQEVSLPEENISAENLQDADEIPADPSSIAPHSDDDSVGLQE